MERPSMIPTKKAPTPTQATKKFTRGRYKKIHALLLTWEDDDLGMLDEAWKLRNVLKKTYSCTTVVSWAIPSSEYAYWLLKGYLEKWFEKHNDPQNLCIVYYGGHSCINADGEMNWAASIDPESTEVEWHRLQKSLHRTETDTLLLFHTCNAATSARAFANYEDNSSEGGVVEMIAACGFETVTPGPGPSSFTKALNHILRYLADHPEADASTTSIHRKVLRRLNLLSKNLEDRVLKPNTPIFIRLGGDLSRPAILLKPLKKKPKKKAAPIFGGRASKFTTPSRLTTR